MRIRLTICPFPYVFPKFIIWVSVSFEIDQRPSNPTSDLAPNCLLRLSDPGIMKPLMLSLRSFSSLWLVRFAEVQIRMRSVGVCATDIHYWTEGRIGDIVTVTDPVILGHECSGVISKIGDGVTNVKVGDRVAIEPLKCCRHCDACVSGKYNLCPNLFAFGKPSDDGGLRQYLVHSSDFVFKLPDNVSFDEAALVEPLSVGLHSCRRAGVQAGDKVLITGAGTIGIMALLAAQASGATSIVLTDLNQSRLEFAKTMGATHTFQVKKDAEAADVAKAITAAMGCSPNKVIECSGAEFSVHLAAAAVKPGGVIALVGLGGTWVSVPMIGIIIKEIEIVGCIGYRSMWPTAIEMLSSGKCNVAPLVTHRFTLQETLKAFEQSRSGAGMKVIIDCNPE